MHQNPDTASSEVIMDNLGSHKAKAVRQLIRTAGAKLLFLPKYSPDLNRPKDIPL
jgi:transposase